MASSKSNEWRYCFCHAKNIALRSPDVTAAGKNVCFILLIACFCIVDQKKNENQSQNNFE